MNGSVVTLTEVLGRIEEIYHRKGTAVIAVDGRCGSGKSTFGAYLKDHMHARFFHMDDFYLQAYQRTPERYAEPGGNVDRERFLDEVLAHLDDPEGITYHLFVHQGFRLGETVHEEYNPITVIEGSYSMRPELSPYYDLSIFLDIDPEVQEERIRRRNGEEILQMFKERWIPLEEKYFREMDVKNRCDLVMIMDGSLGDPNEKEDMK